MSRTSGSEAQVLLLVPLDRVQDHLDGDLALLPSYDLDAPTFKILVDVEEVLDFLQVMLRQVGDIEVAVVERIVGRHGDDLVVRLAAIEHLEHAEWSAVDLAARECRLVDADDYVEGIVVLVQCPWDEPVIAGIMDR